MSSGNYYRIRLICRGWGCQSTKGEVNMWNLLARAVMVGSGHDTVRMNLDKKHYQGWMNVDAGTLTTRREGSCINRK